MGERKVLNKYFPPDFDPAKLPKGSKGKDAQMKVRMMLAMSVRCSTCGNYMYKGTKFNMRMENVVGEEYLGLTVFRFYFHCKQCSAEITMKTDPKNSDYALEHGATRNYEPWRDKDKTVAEAVAAREEEERGNAMKALENRTLDSKNEMDIMDALDELQALNKRHGRVDTEAAIAALRRSANLDEAALADEDEAAIRWMMHARASQVKRLDEQKGAAEQASRNAALGASSSATDGAASSDANGAAAAAPAAANGSAKAPPKPVAKPKFSVKPRVKAVRKAADGGSDSGKPPGGKRAASADAAAEEPPQKKVQTDAGGGGANGGGSPSGSSGGLAGLLGGYGSSGSDS